MRAARRRISSSPAISRRLRELALRRTADRVDDQMVDYLRQNAIEGPWATAERLARLRRPRRKSRRRSCAPRARLATGLNATGSRYTSNAPARKSRIRRSVRSVSTRRCGSPSGWAAEIERVSGRRSRRRSSALRAARKHHADRPRPVARRPIRRLLRRSLPDEIVRRAHDIAVHVVWPGGRSRRPERRARSRSTTCR